MRHPVEIISSENKDGQKNSGVGHPNMCFHLSKLFDAFVFAAFQAYAAL